MTEPTLLRVDGIRKVYGGEIALADASLSVGQGSIHGLLGANGAGKSTLVRIICGVEPQDAGTISIAEEQMPVPHSTKEAVAAGVGYIHQDRALIPDLSIAENVSLTLGYPTRTGLVSMAGMRREAERALRLVDLRHSVDTPVRELPIADQTMIAIVRALAQEARLILLDEPTANLGASEAQWLYGRLRRLAESGVSCVLITHALAEALDVCDTITVLRDGRVVATRPASELDEAAVTELMVGAVPEQRQDHVQVTGARERLRLTGVSFDRLGPLSLDAAEGEIVAVTGLADSGHLLVGDVLIGDARLDGGEMRLNGERFEPRDVTEARRLGVGYVPPDRVREGLAIEMTARENLYLSGSQFSRRPWGINGNSERAGAATALREGRVKPSDPEAPLTTLSGGNQQKILVAKELAADPTLLVLAEPTVGVDVSARADIYARLRAACGNGLTVLLASSDFEEVMALADRVVVLRHGGVVATLEKGEVSISLLHARSGELSGDGVSR